MARRGVEKWQKPDDLKAVGLIFYGRKNFISILDCCLSPERKAGR